MLVTWHTMGRFWAPALIALSVGPGCGGKSAQTGDEAPGAAGSAGAAGRGGGGMAGAGATGGTGATGGHCVQGVNRYRHGETFPAGDGCNTCHCQNGTIGCTLAECDACQVATNAYELALEEARHCDPSLGDEQCAQRIPVGLVCGCESFVNPARAEAVERMSAAAQEFSENACSPGVLCGPCAPPLAGRCSSEGLCVDVPSNGGRACKVGGRVYAHGEGAIPDPRSCNSCSCDDGALTCTEIGCPTTCPDGSAYGTECARCGPADDCEIVEHGCLPLCDGDGACSDPGAVCGAGLCRIGICG
jgi:hypothetical protein